MRPDDDVDHAVLVFQGDEDGALGGGRTLALGDQAGDMHAAAVGAALQVAQTQDAPLTHLRAQQRHRMLAQTQADRAVIGEDFFARVRCFERHRALFRATWQQRATCLYAGHCPARGVAVAHHAL